MSTRYSTARESESDGTYVYGKNTFFAELNGAKLDDLKDRLNRMFALLRNQQLIPMVPPTTKDYILNHRPEKQTAYVFIPNALAFNYIAGCDANGKIRYREIVIPSTKSIDGKKAAITNYMNAKIDCWADDIDDLDKIKAEYDDKKEYVLDPVVTVGGLKFYLSDDSDSWRSTALSGEIVLMRARVKPCYEGLIPNILRVTGFPDSFSVEKIKNLFAIYSVSTDRRYPEVHQQKGSFKVTFDPNTADAFFAQIMTLHNRVTVGDTEIIIKPDYWRRQR